MRHVMKRLCKLTQVEVSLILRGMLCGGNMESREVMVGIPPYSHNFIKGAKFLEEVAGV